MSKVINLSDFSENPETIFLRFMTEFWEEHDLYWELSEGGFHLWSAYVDAGNTIVKSELKVLAAAANQIILEYNKDRILEESYPEFKDHMTLLSEYYELDSNEIKKMSVKLNVSMLKTSFDLSTLAWNEDEDELRLNEKGDDDEFDDDEFDAEFEQEAHRVMQKTCNIHVRIDLDNTLPFGHEAELSRFIKNIAVGVLEDELIQLYQITMDENNITFSIDCTVGFALIMCELLKKEFQISPDFSIIRNLNENCFKPDDHYTSFMNIYRDMDIPELDDIDELNNYFKKFNAQSPEERRKQNPNARVDDEYAATLLYNLSEEEGIAKAKKILQTNRHNIEAQLLIAGWEGDLEKRIDLLLAASDIRNLGYEYTRIQKEKMWWGESHTRPFMRAKYLLAKTYEFGGYIDDAIEGYKEIIHMNPSDNLGARIELMRLLCKLEDIKEMVPLINKYPNEVDVYFAFMSVYASFMKHGKSSKTDKKIIFSLQSNYYLAAAIAKIEASLFEDIFDLSEDDDRLLYENFEQVSDDILPMFKNVELLKYYRKLIKAVLDRVIND
ncbi:MAG TPA: hypothetical protein PKD51_18460 [Saprospiraceae bacterium]|nr:hypothetical protein [Saprospiraceae bacterium]HMU03119.1 hypothetical protein [Saprospiraceae bacterium]